MATDGLGNLTHPKMEHILTEEELKNLGNFSVKSSTLVFRETYRQSGGSG
jgi:hypothetical protein